MTQVKSGMVGGDKNNNEWHLHEGTEVRQQRFSVKFEPHFSTVPHIVASLTHVDSTELRIAVTVENPSISGCDIIFNTWADTKIFGAHASWLAIVAS